MWRTWIVLVKFLVFHEHDSDCKIQKEEWAYDNARDEIKGDKVVVEGILVDVHDVGPALHCYALEDC